MIFTKITSTNRFCQKKYFVYVYDETFCTFDHANFDISSRNNGK